MNPSGTNLYEMLIMMLAASTGQPNQELVASQQIRGSHVIAVSEFKKSEGCMAGFKRLGYNVKLSQCVESAKKAGITPVWSNNGGTVRIDVPVKEGDPFAVVEKNGKKQFILYKPK